jgi:hypothetical protein
MPSRAVVWFRGDLRVTDRPALLAALDAADQVVPVFVSTAPSWMAAPAEEVGPGGVGFRGARCRGARCRGAVDSRIP